MPEIVSASRRSCLRGLHLSRGDEDGYRDLSYPEEGYSKQLCSRCNRCWRWRWIHAAPNVKGTEEGAGTLDGGDQEGCERGGIKFDLDVVWTARLSRNISSGSPGNLLINVTRWRVSRLLRDTKLRWVSFVVRLETYSNSTYDLGCRWWFDHRRLDQHHVFQWEEGKQLVCLPRLARLASSAREPRRMFQLILLVHLY